MRLGLAAPAEPPDPDAPDIIVDFDADPADQPTLDENGNVIEIKHGDGTVTVSLDGKPIEEAANDTGPQGWFENLADRIPEDTLSIIVEELLQGIADDLTSRQEWIDQRAQGTVLLGLKVEIPGVQGASDGAPVEGMSKVRHPLLLEAILRFQATSRGEFLPTDGPVKMRNDDPNATSDEDLLANAFQQDFNHYLTVTATEYYPDTEKMLFQSGFSGDGFVKVYACPLRNRPVAESVDADDLIVNQSATDLGNAIRVTQRIMMKPSTVKRMQIVGAYRDITLGQAIVPDPDALKEAQKEQQGLRAAGLLNPKDQERTIYECYCELDIPGYEHKQHGKITGLPIPYRVTIDLSDRKALAIVRNFDEPEDDDLPTAKTVFVKFPFAPGPGFYDIGLLHILGNTANAATAGWRLMLDNGMFACFPGFLTGKASSRQNTNIFRVPPGGSAQIETGGMAIRDFAMPLPYNTGQMPPLMSLIQEIVETGRRIGGTAEVQVGEGRADVPVGTTLAMIEQAIKVMDAVHKRMYSSFARVFQLLLDEFKKNPRALCKCKTKTAWDLAKITQALANCNLVPQADPNTSSSGQRLMKIMGLIQLQGQFPTLLDPVKICTTAIASMGWANPQEFMVPKQAQAAPPPQLIQAQAELADKQQATAAKTTEAQAKMIQAQGVAAKAHAEAQTAGLGDSLAAAPGPEPLSPLDIAKAEAAVLDAKTRARDVALKERMASVEDRNRDLDREAKERDTMIGLAKEFVEQPQTTTGPDGGKKVSRAPKATNAGKKAVKVRSEIDKNLK
jgi:hypothetical protein